MSQSYKSSSLFDIRGIVAVVTGEGSGMSASMALLLLGWLITIPAGLGLNMTRALAENGAKKVYILGRRRKVLDDAAKEIVRTDDRQ